MKKASQIIIRLAVLTIILSAFVSVHAQDYVPLAPLPGIGDAASGGKTNLTDYIPAAFKLSVGIAAGMAFVVITIGGVMYATSDAISGKSTGREWIENAIYGLLLVIGAYAILYTINPQILKFSLSLERPAIREAGAGTPVVVDNSSCPTCRPLSFSSNMKVADSFAVRLESFNNVVKATGLSWYVTEGWAPTGHKDPCHANGTCVDASILPKTSKNINAFITAAQSSGFTLKWEVQTQGEKDALVKGVPPVSASNILVNSDATGSHFHMK